MNSRAEIFRNPVFWLLLLYLSGCALLPARKEIGVEPAPQEALQQLAKAEVALQEGNLEEAFRLYRELAIAFPRTPQAAKALLGQAEIDFQLEHYQEAASRYQKVINQFPVRPEGDTARLGLLRCYVKLERFNDAVETGRSLTTYLSEKSQRAAAAEIVGDAQTQQLNYGEAVQWYAKAYGLAEKDNRAVVVEKIDTALKQVRGEQVQELLNEYPEGFINLLLQTRLVEIGMETGQLGIAQEELKTLIEKHPLHPFAETWRTMAERIEEWLKVDMASIGCVLPLTGRYQAYGDKVLRGLVMAAQDFKGGAVGAREIQLIVKDSGGQPTLAAAAVRELVLDHKVAAIVGPLSRVAAEAAAREAQKLWVPIITLTQKRGVSDIGNYVFRHFLSNEQQTRALVNYSVLGLGYRRFAILYPDDSYGTRLVHMFWDELDRLGAEVRGVEAYAPSQTDFADQIKKLVGLYYPRPESEITDDSEQDADGQVVQDSVEDENGTDIEEEILPIVDFDAIFIPDSYSQVGLIAPQLAYHDVTDIRLLGTNLWNSAKLVEMAAPYLQEAVFVDGFFPGSNLPLTRQFVQRYQAIFADKPGYPEAQAYDTLRLLAAALRQPEVTSRPVLRNALLEMREFPGVAGTASVSTNGEIHKTPFLITIYGRRMEEVQVDLEELNQQRTYLESFNKDQMFFSAPELQPMPGAENSAGSQ